MSHDRDKTERPERCRSIRPVGIHFNSLTIDAVEQLSRKRRDKAT